jgi:hypothetical protein
MIEIRASILLLVVACGGGDGNGNNPPGDGGNNPDGSAGVSCRLVPPLLAKGLLNAGNSSSVSTPATVSVIGVISGGEGPYVAEWSDGVGFRTYTSPTLATASNWDASFEYSSNTGWSGTGSDDLGFKVTDLYTDGERVFTRESQGTLCVDVNRTNPVCPLPFFLDSVTATADASDPMTLHFNLELTHPEIDCSGFGPNDGLTYQWNFGATSPDGVTNSTDKSPTFTFAEPNILGTFYLLEVYANCFYTYEPGYAFNFQAFSEFYVDCH